jgi:uncharacterized protein
VTFIWDEGKRRSNLKKHGVDFRDAAEMFAGPVWVELDAREDYGEDRFRGVGFIKGRLMVVVFSETPSSKIRIISLRKARKHEQEKFDREIGNRLGQG